MPLVEAKPRILLKTILFPTDFSERSAAALPYAAAIARHYAWVDYFWHPTAESYRGLGRGYAEHPEFRAFYEKYRPGLADFMCAAMAYYADHTLAA